MSVNTQPRVPAGVPQGGQWAPSRHAEPDVDDLCQAPAAVLATVQRSARRAATRYSLDTDDVVGEALLRLYSTARKKDNGNAYVATTVKRTAIDMLMKRRNGLQVSSFGHRAYREYAAICATMEQRLGRHLTSAEQEALAEQVREQCDRRVSREFYRRRIVLTTGATPAELAKANPGSFVYQRHSTVPGDAGGDSADYEDGRVYHERRSFREGSLAEATERLAENDEGGNNLAATQRARMQVWDSLAEEVGAPTVARGTLNPKAVTGMRKLVAGAGGVKTVVDAYRNGRLDDSVASAFFAPFGDIDDEERAKVVGLLANYPAYSDDLWNAAAGAASRERKQREKTGG